MPNVLELLNHDHREVEQLFTRFASTQDRTIALQICDELTVHTTVEEELVYPVLAEIDADLEREGEQEHDEAEQLIERIQAMGEGDPDLVRTVRKLEAAVQHHVQEEESEAWPKMRSGAGDQLEELGRRVQERKEELHAGATTPMFSMPTEVRGSATTDLDGKTRDELYEMAKDADIPGRSTMKKAELQRALRDR